MADKTIEQIVVRPLSIGIIPVRIIGLRPLIFHKWSEKAKRMMREKQQKKAAKGHEVRDPQAEFEASFYRNSNGEIAFPAIALKKALTGACRNVTGVTMTLVRGAVFVVGDHEGLVRVDYKGEPEMREDAVTVGIDSADLRYRGQLTEWSMELTIKHNVSVISAEQVINLFRVAGFACGIGEWRPEKSGDYGQFDVQMGK